MKEFKFKDTAGFEDQDLPRQLDDFEAKGAKALKTRYIFDFSALSGSTIIPIDSSPTYYGRRSFKNLTPNEDWDMYIGNPGEAELLVDGIQVFDTNYDGSLPKVQNTHINSVQLDISGERDVPYWEENAMIYLDSGIPGAYGTGANENYIKTFRSGYVELTFKTNKSNCILGFGSAKKTDYGFKVGPVSVGPRPENTGGRIRAGAQNVIDSNDSYLTDDATDVDSLSLNLENGKLKLSYQNEYGNTQKAFTILGLTNLADNQWHHVVINFNKPGVIEKHGKKINKKFIEFWIDGKLEKRDDQYINDNQVFFPIIEWLMMDPILATLNPAENWAGYDKNLLPGGAPAGLARYLFVGESEYNNLISRRFNPIAKTTAFRGSFNHFISGINFPLNKYEIQQRYRLFNFFDKPPVNIFSASANIVQPTISVNKKRALKLFWNNLINEKAKNGIELDNNFIIDSYSITHKTLNSKTEINNIDMASLKELKFLKDVKAVFKDYVNIFGPGRQNLYSRPEIWNAQVGEQYQLNMANYPFDALNSIDLNMSADIKSRLSPWSVKNMPFSGLNLQAGDRILLTNQFNKKDNGVYIFNGYGETLIRAEDASSPSQLQNAVVRVIDGYYKDTSWILSNTISSLSENQNWIELEYHPESENINSQPVFGSKWSDQIGNERFINLEQDLNISQYDLIVFANYPNSNEEVYNSSVNLQLSEIKKNYDDFIKSLKNVCAQGASLYVSSPKLATDLGIVKKFTEVSQQLENSDAQSASINPFEFSESAGEYFDTHRVNKYNLATTITGLTNKETYILTDFINYAPNDVNKQEQYHAKYSYRQLGLQEGNEFIIPGLALRKIANNENLPGFLQNQKGIKPLLAVAPQDIITGTIITKLANNYYSGSTVVTNNFDDYATTIVVYNNQVLGGQPISGKIFINCVEDGYTFSRKEYNKAIIQTLPQTDINESVATRAWQYSTSRLNRSPRKINISAITLLGQTTPTNGGGGPLIQAPTNSSNGVIRSETDKNNINYQSDLYPRQDEEIYTTQEIPVLSMTWLGLQWLAE